MTITDLSEVNDVHLTANFYALAIGVESLAIGPRGRSGGARRAHPGMQRARVI
jgi:hypothetical protein